LEDTPDSVTFQSYSAPGAHGMEEMFGPTQADDAVRLEPAAVWRSLPRGKRDPKTVEQQSMRLTKRTIANYHEDVDAFDRD